MKRPALVLLFYLLSFCLAQTCDFQNKTLLSSKERKELFAQVWETVNEEYIYPDFRGMDWGAAREDYGKKILEVKTNEAFYTVVDEMIIDLGDDHSVYLSPALACEEDTLTEGEDLSTEEPSVTRLETNPDVLFVDLPSLNLYDAGVLLETQLRKSLQKGRPSALILDLRHNYGGYIDVAYEVLSHFVRGRFGTEFDLYKKYPIRGETGMFYPHFNDVPMVVLVDADTHSAAELVAGVLQKTHHATVIGQTSAGNTEILLPFDFDDGSRLYLAIGGFTLADGTNLEGRGVIPDVVIDKTAKDDMYINAGLEALGLQSRAE